MGPLGRSQSDVELARSPMLERIPAALSPRHSRTNCTQGKGGGSGGGGHKGRWDPTDDGSEAQAVDGIADKGDPNYDSEADDHDNNYVLVRKQAWDSDMWMVDETA